MDLTSYLDGRPLQVPCQTRIVLEFLKPLINLETESPWTPALKAFLEIAFSSQSGIF